MDGRDHDGVVLAMNSSGDMLRTADWDKWYVEELWPTLSVPGLSNGSLFSLSEGYELPSSVTHAAVFERNGGDASAAVAELTRQLAVPAAGTSRPPSSRAHVTSYTKIDQIGDATGRKAAGIVLIFLDALHAEQEDEFNTWYDEHGPHVLDHIDHYALTRYVADDPGPWQPKYISIYETEGDVEKVCREGYEWYMSTITEDYVPQARLWWERPLERRA